MNPVESWHAETLGAEVVEALKESGFNAVYVPTSTEAADMLLSFVSPGSSVGFGGSMTIKSMGIQERVAAKGGIVLDHGDPSLTPEEKLEILRKELTCDLFVSSSNAVTLEGDIVNVDGNGNRVAALSFGPSKTVVVVGVNKIVRDMNEALARIELYASPMNNKRLNKPNPCVKAGVCVDCQGDTRICRVYQVLHRKPSLSDFTVIIVGETLGF